MKKRGTNLGMNKAGQVTVFIIIGVILLIASSIIVYVKLKGTETNIESQIPAEKKLPGELDSIRIGIKSCLEKTAVDGLELVGMQSGWVSTTDSSLTGKDFVFVPDVTLSDGVFLGSIKLPYWYHMKSDNKCTSNCMFSFDPPVLKSAYAEGKDRPVTDTSIEAQLDRYIIKNMGACINEIYENYRPRFNIEEKSSLVPTTTVTRKEVLVVLDYVVEISDAQTTSLLEQSYARLDMPLYEIYGLAYEIVNAESMYSFIENNVMNMVTINSGIDRAKFPPIADSNLGPSGVVVWTKSAVKEKLKEEVLIPFTQAIQLPKTKNYRESFVNLSGKTNILTRMQQGVASGFSYNVLNNSYENYDTNFVYLDWPIYFDITPNNGELIEPKSSESDMGGLMQVFMQSYVFRYDISYPVIVIIESEDALKGKGYLFQFALEGNIRNNKPFGPGDSVPDIDVEQVPDLWASPSQRLSGDIIIKTYDKKTEDPLPGVIIKYSCGPNSVVIGETEYDSEGEAVLIERFPICVGGVLEFSRPDYMDYTIAFDTEIGKSEVIIVGAKYAVPKNIDED